MFHTKDTPCFPVVIDAISRRADFQHLDCIPPESAWIGNLKRSVPVTGTRRTTRAAEGTLRAGALVLVVIIAAAASAPEVARAAKNCYPTKYASIDVVITKESEVLLPVTIKGHEAYMVLETAVGPSALYRDAARDFNLRAMPLPASSRVMAGSQPIAEYVNIRELTIKDYKFFDTYLLLRDTPVLRSDPTAARPIVGIAGMSLFDKVDLELNLAKSNVSLYSQKHCRGNVVTWSKDYHSLAMTRSAYVGNEIFTMALDGQNLDTTLSTASTFSGLHSDAAKTLFCLDEHSPDVVTASDLGGKNPTHYLTMDLSSPGFTMQNVRVQLRGEAPVGCKFGTAPPNGAAGYSGCEGIVPLTLGLSVLKHLHLYLATRDNILYFTSSNSGTVELPMPVQQ